MFFAIDFVRNAFTSIQPDLGGKLKYLMNHNLKVV